MVFAATVAFPALSNATVARPARGSRSGGALPRDVCISSNIKIVSSAQSTKGGGSEVRSADAVSARRAFLAATAGAALLVNPTG
jgi:hypothetical protein